MEKPVRMCACAMVSFRTLKEAGVANVQEASERFGCGRSCRTCVPYIERMLETGETEFEVFEP